MICIPFGVPPQPPTRLCLSDCEPEWVQVWYLNQLGNQTWSRLLADWEPAGCSPTGRNCSPAAEPLFPESSAFFARPPQRMRMRAHLLIGCTPATASGAGWSSVQLVHCLEFSLSLVLLILWAARGIFTIRFSNNCSYRPQISAWQIGWRAKLMNIHFCTLRVRCLANLNNKIINSLWVGRPIVCRRFLWLTRMAVDLLISQ
jgi:hypothetical protein